MGMFPGKIPKVVAFTRQCTESCSNSNLILLPVFALGLIVSSVPHYVQKNKLCSAKEGDRKTVNSHKEFLRGCDKVERNLLDQHLEVRQGRLVKQLLRLRRVRAHRHQPVRVDVRNKQLAYYVELYAKIIPG
jgi:hypothetical protein